LPGYVSGKRSSGRSLQKNKNGDGRSTNHKNSIQIPTEKPDKKGEVLIKTQKKNFMGRCQHYFALENLL